MAVTLTLEYPIAIIELNRRDKLNAITQEMRVQFREILHQVRYDDEVRAVILTGAGKAFCAGADVSKMTTRDLRAVRTHFQMNVHPIIKGLHDIEKPVIAAVRGAAVGIGWSFALACDIVVASTTARFSQVFRKVGLAPDGGAVWFLLQRLGMARAKELVFSARFVGAEEALQLGLVNFVVEDDRLMEEARKLALDYASGPTFAFGMAKQLFHQASGRSLDDYLVLEALAQPQLDRSLDHEEGKASFAEKRAPNFRGR